MSVPRTMKTCQVRPTLCGGGPKGGRQRAQPEGVSTKGPWAGQHAEQVNPELVNFLGQKLGARGEVA